MSGQRNGHSLGVLAKAGALTAALAAAMLVPPAASAQDGGTLRIATWGGAYGQSQEIAFFEPFAKETGTKIAAVIYDGSLAGIRKLIEDSDSPADVIDVSPAALAALCNDGLLETIDASSLEPAPGGASAEEDFLAGALSTCGVASVAWSTAIAFNRRAFAKNPPAGIAALLDSKTFPGKRALPNGPRYTLELALMADGVAPDDVYGELATDAGVDRALAALDRIKGDILWWDKAEQPVEWLLDNKASMATGFSGRIFRALAGQRQRLGVIWDGQVYDLDVWAIPKDAENKDTAKRFVAFATSPERVAAQAQLIAYGPMRKSALDLVGKHPVVNLDMKEYLPTSPDNFKSALRYDDAWWNEHGEKIGKRFQDWKAGTKAVESPSPGTASNGQPSDAAPAEAQ